MLGDKLGDKLTEIQKLSNSRRKQYKQTSKGRYYTTYRHYKKRIMDCKSKR